MTEGISNLEERIVKFESLLQEMREETREAHSTLKEIHKMVEADRKYRELLIKARDELRQWGWGDMHYGDNTPQSPRIVELIATINLTLEKYR